MKINRKRGAALLAGVGLALSAAGSAKAEVRWRAPSECPKEEEIQARARALDTAEKRVPDVVIHVEKRGAKYAAELTIGQASPRVFDADTCAAVADGALLILSLNVVPVEAVPAPSGPPAVSALVVVPAPTPVRKNAKTNERSSFAFVSILPLVDVGTLPRTAPGLEVAFGALFGKGKIEGAMHAFLPEESVTPLGTRAAFDAIGGLVRATWFLGERARIGPSVGLALERWSGSSRLAEVNGNAVALVVAPEIGASLDVPISKVFHIVGGLEALLPLNRPAYVLEGFGEVHRASPVLGRARFGVEAQF